MDARVLVNNPAQNVRAFPSVISPRPTSQPWQRTHRSLLPGVVLTTETFPNSLRTRTPRSHHVTNVAQWSSPKPETLSNIPSKRLAAKVDPEDVPEAHKVFDEVVVVVRSGHGGNGEIVPAGRGRYVSNHKYKPGGNQPKQLWLPASEPGEGADGGDVVLVCDPGVDSLLHLHPQAKKGAAGGGGGKATGRNAGGAAGAAVFSAPDGSNANPNTGSAGPKRNKDIKKARTPCLEIPVPPGTVVKRRGSGALLGELLQPGQRLTVARGGPGGHGVVAPSRQQRQARIGRAEREARAKGVELVDVEDDNWKAESRGQEGQQLTLTLLLRVVADVGLVGFPNAGKSSLLKALTRASPTIAPYPFTTLMPNLGVLSAGGGATKAVLADLPGLIEGAHKGRGLGRNFLRHLRRTRALLHVVDAAGPDPATDYYAVREELRMYNPEYCVRPHVVALNKTDLLGAAREQDGAAGQQRGQPAAVSQLVSAIREAARRQAAEHAEFSHEGPAPLEPLAVVPCSAATGEGLRELAAALQRAIGASRVAEPDIVRPAPDTLAAARAAPAITPAAADAAAAATTTAAAAVAAAATASAVAIARPASVPAPRRTTPPPPPPGWDDDAAEAGDWTSAAGGFDGEGDDAALELAEGELELFTSRCHELGLMDEAGNFTGAHVDLGDDSEDGDPEGAPRSRRAGELGAAAAAHPVGCFDPDQFDEDMSGMAAAAAVGQAGTAPVHIKVHDTLDEQEQSYLDEHLPTSGDAAVDGDDEWVDLSTLDEQTLAAVLDELERSGAFADDSGLPDGEASGSGGSDALLDWRRDFRLAPEGPGSAGTRDVTEPAGSAAVVDWEEKVALRLEESAGGGVWAGAEQARTAVGEGSAGDDDDSGEPLVRMASPDDPDARLVNLSLEELLAMEKEW